MGLAEITRPGVRAAVAEFDRLGREQFLNTYRFGRARAYFLRFGENLYDSKAIVAYAHGEVPGQRRWTTDDFTGGEESVARQLHDRLGFTIEVHRGFWTRGELILACDLVWANEWHELRSEYHQVIELSELLQQYWIHPTATRSETFRSPGSVSRKTSDIATRHTSYTRTPTRGNKLDGEVLADFEADPDLMHAQAVALRAAITAGALISKPVDDLAEPEAVGDGVAEGELEEGTYLRRSRDRSIRDRAIATHKERHRSLACEICGFDFAAAYGPHGEDYIEVHHRTPLSESGATVTRVTDLVMLCANCHRMIHRRRPWLTVNDLTKLVAEVQSTRPDH